MQYNVYFDVAGLLILAIILCVFYLNYKIESMSNKLYIITVLFTVATIIFDIISALLSGKNAPLFFLHLTNALFFIFGILLSACCFLYICSVSKYKLNKVEFIFLFAVLVVYIIMILINPFTKILYYFDESHLYQFGTLYYVNYFAPIVFLLYMIKPLAQNIRKFTAKQILANFSFIACQTLFSFLQMLLFPNILLTCFGTSLSMLMILFSLETPDFVELEYLKKNLEKEVSVKTAEVEELSLQTILALAQVLDAKDEYTRGHSARVAVYSREIARAIGYSEEELVNIYNGAFLHDIGKIGVPDAILNKPGRLTDDEYDVIKSHTLIGSEILTKVKSLPKAEYIARHHHERYDGHGYPDGLMADNISMDARIVAVADAYDAMNTSRVYRSKLDPEAIKYELEKNKGKQFDPWLINVFVDLMTHVDLDAMCQIAEEHHCVSGDHRH